MGSPAKQRRKRAERANAKGVLADPHPSTFVEPDLTSAVVFAPLERAASRCLELLDDEPARRSLESRAQSIKRQRDIRQILRAALEGSGLASS